MTGLKRNLLFSSVLHLTIMIIIIVAFCRGTEDRAPANYMMVSLLKEITDIAPKTSVTPPAPGRGEKNKTDNNDIVSPLKASLNDISIRESTGITPGENTKRNSETETNNHEHLSEFANTRETFSQHENNPVKSLPFDKTRYDSIPTGTAGSSVQNILVQDTDSLYTMIRTAIEKAKKYPFLARKRRIEGIVFMAFTIDRKGYPQDIKVRKSSGHEILDSSAIQIVKNAAPLPYVKGEITIPISFRLTDSQTYIYH